MTTLGLGLTFTVDVCDARKDNIRANDQKEQRHTADKQDGTAVVSLSSMKHGAP